MAPVQNRKGVAVTTSLLVLLAVTAKLAFVTLGQTKAAVSLLADGTGSFTLHELERDRSQLQSMLARVTEEEKEKIREKALKEERNEEAKKLRREQQKLASHSRFKGDYGVKTDESMVKWILGKSDKERSQQELSRRAAILQKSISKNINMRKDREKQIESEAAIELRKEGLISGSPSINLKRPSSDERQLRSFDEHLKENNQLLKQEVLALNNQAKRSKALRRHRKLGPGGETGLAHDLSKVGVVVDSWGPITSDVSTKPDPRDNFAKRPGSHEQVVSRKTLQKLRILPSDKISPVRQQVLSENELEKDLGFKGSFMYSHSFSHAQQERKKPLFI